MTAFERAVELVLRHEGGLGEHADDPGGITNFGISLRFAGSVKLDIDGDGFTTKADIVALTRGQAVELYRRHFWLPMRCEEMAGAIAYPVFDCAVNQGLGAAARLLQRALGVPQDGVLGPITMAAVEAWAASPRRLVAWFVGHRNTRYARLAVESVKARSFIGGWLRRSAEVHDAAAHWQD